MRTGDTIKHNPSGETWTVAATDGTSILCCGWPETMAPITDCTLVKSCSEAEHVELLAHVAEGSDLRASWARHTLKAQEASNG